MIIAAVMAFICFCWWISFYHLVISDLVCLVSRSARCGCLIITTTSTMWTLIMLFTVLFLSKFDQSDLHHHHLLRHHLRHCCWPSHLHYRIWSCCYSFHYFHHRCRCFNQILWHNFLFLSLSASFSSFRLLPSLSSFAALWYSASLWLSIFVITFGFVSIIIFLITFTVVSIVFSSSLSASSLSYYSSSLSAPSPSYPSLLLSDLFTFSFSSSLSIASSFSFSSLSDWVDIYSLLAVSKYSSSPLWLILSATSKSPFQSLSSMLL